jgi:hypothetical protein
LVKILGVPPPLAALVTLSLPKCGVGLYAAIPAKECRGYSLPSLTQLIVVYHFLHLKNSKPHFLFFIINSSSIIFSQ